MIFHKQARPTLTGVELDIGDELHFVLADGQVRRIILRDTHAWVTHKTGGGTKPEKIRPVTNYVFGCTLEIEGVTFSMMREVASQGSFYQPREFMGLRIWLDAVDNIFEFLAEDHGSCKPRRKARLALQDATLGICPQLLHPWCPLPEGTLRIADCYRGEDCWLGAYDGNSAHGGLDINHPAGTPIFAPIAFDDHELFDRLGRGANNNRWRGTHRWPDGSTWILQVHHLLRLLVTEHEPIPAGAQIAEGAGALTGDYEHSHFVFAIIEPGESFEDRILLDPWILFWQMYRDRERTLRS